jgi:hypothetical protein
MVQNFEVMFGINAQPLCVQFCNFVQWYIVVNYLTIAVSE